MGCLLFIFLLYFLCLAAERALVNLSAHDIDVLKEEDAHSARLILLLSTEIRSTLASLLLARVLLLSLSGVIAITLLTDSGFIDSCFLVISKIGKVPLWLIWLAAIILLALGLATAFWGIQKIDFQKKKEGLAALFLKRLWWFIFFWKVSFGIFIQKEKKSEVVEEEKDKGGSGSKASSEKRELELLKSIVQFGDVTVKQVMQPRSKIISVEFRTGFHALLEIVRKSEFSRLPVCDEDLDNVTGILYVKDLVPHLDKDDSFEWQRLIRTNVLMVPEAKRGSELLQEFKLQRLHMAIVVDEYGGIAGIVTMEDILEEVTGDIRDEFDEESEIHYRKIDDFNYLFEGQTLLNDVCRISGLLPGTFDTARGTAETLAGLVLELRGDIPLISTEIDWNGFLLTVTIADKRRVEQVKLTLPKQTVLFNP